MYGLILKMVRRFHRAGLIDITAQTIKAGEQRLAIALRLHELACDVARAGIRARHPDADDVEVERLLRARIALGYRQVGSRGSRPSDD